MKPNVTARLFIVPLVLVGSLTTASLAQQAAVDDPITAAQVRAAQRVMSPAGIGAAITGIGAAVTNATDDPILAAQVLAAAKKTFPNLAADLNGAKLLRHIADDPTHRGRLRGRMAEEEWINRNAKDGWKAVKNPNAPQNDAWRRVDGHLEGAQVKVHADWHKYIPSMRKDDKAERYVLPDDQYELVYKELETRRLSALRGGLIEKAAEYEGMQNRLTKIGRTFAEYDEAAVSAARNLSRIAAALKMAGKTASFAGITLALLDNGIKVYEVATGKAEVEELVAHLGKTVIGGGAAWALGDAAAGAAVAVGATGAVPVAVVIVVGTATYLVVDWAIDAVTDSLRVGHLTAEDITRIWPEGARGVSLDRLYRKAKDPAVLVQ